MNKEEFKFNSTTGGVEYLIVDYKNKTISNDFYKYNGGHKPCKMVQLKEIKRLTNYFINQGYKHL